jgi:uncharacterized protein (DUF433 family)
MPGKARAIELTGESMPNSDMKHAMDWTGCDLVERVPGKVSGRPVVKGTRILADQIVEEAELGSPVEEIAENYPSLTVAKIRKLLAFAHDRQPLPQ